MKTRVMPSVIVLGGVLVSVAIALLKARVAPPVTPQPTPPPVILASSQGEPVCISMSQLLAGAQACDGQQVRVIGFMHLEFEGDALYLHREDFEQALVTNSVSLSVPSRRPEISALNDRYVLVEGTFRLGNPSSARLRVGRIEAVSRVHPWPSRREVERQLR